MSLDAVRFLALNASQAGGALLFLLAAHGFGALLLRLTNLRRVGVAGLCLDILCGLAVLTGLSGWMALGWVFTRPMGYAVLSAGWVMSVFVVVQDLYRRPPLHTPSSTLARVKQSTWTERIVCVGVLGLAALLGLLAYAHEFAWADDWRYHLTLPRRILADAGYRYDSFMPEANFNYGGEHGLHALMLLLGGEVTYQMLSPAAALLLLSGILYAFLKPRYGVVSSAAALAAMLGCNFFWRMGFITLAPDVLMAAIVAGLLYLLLSETEPRKHAALGTVCGLLLGGLIAIKTVNLFVIPLVVLAFGLRKRDSGMPARRAFMGFGAGTIAGLGVVLLPWVLIGWRNTGSPLFPFVGDRRDIFEWFLARDMVLLDAPMGIAAWMRQQFYEQYVQARGGLLGVYALLIPGIAAIGLTRARRRRPTSPPPTLRPLMAILPATALASAYFIYSRGTDLNTHTRYLLPLALPCIACAAAWSVRSYLRSRRVLPSGARWAIDAALVAALGLNAWGGSTPFRSRVLHAVAETVPTLAWGDLSEQFWRHRSDEPAYRGFNESVPSGARVLTYVQKTALIDASKYQPNSITKTLSGSVDVHRETNAAVLAGKLRAAGFEYVFVTLEWLQGPQWAVERAPAKLSDWSAAARTLENLVRLRDAPDVTVVRSYPNALILSLGPPLSPAGELELSSTVEHVVHIEQNTPPRPNLKPDSPRDR